MSQCYWSMMFCVVANSMVLGSAVLLWIWIPQTIANIFRGVADMSHLFAMLMLVYRLVRQGSSGVSARSQELYLAVFLCRYIDVLYAFDWYLTTMKAIFVVVTVGTRLLVRRSDRFPHWRWLAAPAALVALVEQTYVYLKYRRGPAFAALEATTQTWLLSTEFLWAFSITLEPLAIVPQLCLLNWHADTHFFEEVETVVGRYVFYLGIYRSLYIANWIKRHVTEDAFSPYHLPPNNILVYSAAVLQASLYLDFAAYYACRKLYGKAHTLSPVKFLRHLAHLGIVDHPSLLSFAAHKAPLVLPLATGPDDKSAKCSEGEARQALLAAAAFSC